MKCPDTLSKEIEELVSPDSQKILIGGLCRGTDGGPFIPDDKRTGGGRIPKHSLGICTFIEGTLKLWLVQSGSFRNISWLSVIWNELPGLRVQETCILMLTRYH